MQSQEIEIKGPSNILHKHLSAVHSSSALTMMQRKTYNILLKNAIRNMHEDRTHQISIKDLKEALGWSDNSNNNDDLKEKLKELARTQVEWNILDKDKKNKWTASTLLADVSIKGSDIFYSYSLSLQGVLSSPNVYAKLNMEVQKLLTNKYALIVWEIICGDLSVKCQNKAVSDWIPYERVLKLLDLIGTCYEKRYALFRNQVMTVAVDEINEKSDLRVVVEERVENRVIKAIRFITERKRQENLPELALQEHRLFARVKDLGFPDRVTEKLIKEHSEKDLECAIDFYVHHISNTQQKVQNPVAFFEKALDKGWVAPQSQIVQSHSDHGVVKGEIQALTEQKECIDVRLLLLDAIGESQYKSWFSTCKMSVSDKKLRIETKGDFSRDYLNNNFAVDLNRIIKGCDLESVLIVSV